MNQKNIDDYIQDLERRIEFYEDESNLFAMQKAIVGTYDALETMVEVLSKFESAFTTSYTSITNNQSLIQRSSCDLNNIFDFVKEIRESIVSKEDSDNPPF